MISMAEFRGLVNNEKPLPLHPRSSRLLHSNRHQLGVPDGNLSINGLFPLYILLPIFLNIESYYVGTSAVASFFLLFRGLGNGKGGDFMDILLWYYLRVVF